MGGVGGLGLPGLPARTLVSTHAARETLPLHSRWARPDLTRLVLGLEPPPTGATVQVDRGPVTLAGDVLEEGARRASPRRGEHR